MPYEIKQGVPGCDAWAVVKQGTDEIMGCHPSQDEAEKQLAALNAIEPGEVSFTADLMPEGVWSSDGRKTALGASRWRALPLPFMLQTENQEGHDGAGICGRLIEIAREDRGEGTAMIVAKGVYASNEAGHQGAELAKTGTLAGVSVDFAVVASEIVGLESDEGAPVNPAEIREEMTEIEILGATQTPFPAFEGARVTSVGQEDTLGAGAVQGGAVLQAAAPPCCPPAAWFADPDLDGPTPLTVTDEGRVFGHLATWGTCHIGRAGCVTAPRNASRYAFFRTGEVVAAGADQPIPVGAITLGTGHADNGIGARDAAAHYDDTGTVAADVAAGDDEIGIWVAGALRPDVTPEQVRTLRAAALSGDWRRIGGSMELVAALAVNVPGFPVPRASLRDGAQLSLVAAGIVRERVPSAGTSLEERMSAAEAEIQDLRRRVAKQGVMIDPLRPLVAARLRDRIKRTQS